MRKLLLAKDWIATMLTLTTLGKSFGWVLPKNGDAFGGGEPSQVTTVNVQAVTINSYEEGQFVQPDTPIVKITAIAPPAEPEDDGITIEGTLVEDDDDQ